MTPASLRNCTCKDLAQMAKSEGVAGWHSMRKDELIHALVKQAKDKRRNRDGRRRLESLRANGADSPAALKARALAKERLHELHAKLDAGRMLAGAREAGRTVDHDRLVVMVRDPYWLHAYWEISSRSVERAQTALGQHWHGTRPILRLFKVSADGSAALERDIPIHGGVRHWYVDVQNPPCQYRMEIGYSSPGVRFYCLARSNAVTTPQAGTSDSVDENWVDVDDNADRIYAMSGGYTPQGTSLELQELLEERLQRPMGTPMQTRYGNGAARSVIDPKELQFAVDAELLVFGVSHPHAHVTMQGEPVPLRSDGSFTVRMSLPDRRQVLPVVASSPDGVEQRTIILAIERNTKVLEAVVREPGA
jgi:uncharacterized protein